MAGSDRDTILYFIKIYSTANREKIHNASFSSYLTDGPKKLECYIIIGRKGRSGTSTQAYWTHLKVINEMKCCNYDPWVQDHKEIQE
jgi:hypothetical protein